MADGHTASGYPPNEFADQPPSEAGWCRARMKSGGLMAIAVLELPEVAWPGARLESALVFSGWFLSATVLCGLLISWWGGRRAVRSVSAATPEGARSGLFPRERPVPPGPLLAIPPLDRRVTAAEVRLHQRFGANADSKHVLGPFHAEVDPQLPPGTEVILCLENQGLDHAEATLTIDGCIAELEQEANSPEELLWIRYAYDPTRRNHPMELVLSYTNKQGILVRDRYRTRHGIRELTRLADENAVAG